MAKANLSRTAFGTNPRKSQEVIDVYKQGELEKFIANPDSEEGVKLVNELYPDLKADKALEILQDPEVKAWMDETGQDLGKYIDSIEIDLPNGVKLNGLLDDFDISFLKEWVGPFKTSLSFDIFKDLDTDGYKDFLKHIKKFSTKFSVDLDTGWVGKLWGEAAGVLPDGLGSFGKVLEMAKKQGIAEKLIESGYAQEAIDWIKNDPEISEDDKKDLLSDLAETLGGSGNWEELDEVLAETVGDMTPFQRTKTIRAILYGYRLPLVVAEGNYVTLGNELSARLAILEKDWNIEYRNGTATDSYRYLSFASRHALLVLSATDANKDTALMYLGWSPYPTSYRVLSMKHIYT